MKNIIVTFCFIFICQLTSLGQFQVNNNAVDLGGGYYRLTDAINNEAGSVWYKLQHDLNTPINIQGQMYFGTDDAGADGIAFVLQNNCLAAGTYGGGIGYAGMPGQSIAVEFDTYQNITGSGDQDNADPPYDHIAIEKSGNVNHADPINNLFGPIQMDATKVNVEDGLWYDFQISYDPVAKVLNVYFDGALRASFNYDILNNIFAGNPYVYWGFTASTGGFNNEQKVYINANLSTFSLTDLTTCTDPVSVSLPPLTKYIGTNVALNKTAVSSSVENAGAPPGNAVDGNMSTRWSSAFTDNEWIYVDLGSVYDIDSVVLYWESAYGKQYNIQTSADASSWTDQYVETNSDGGKDKIVFSATNVRYVRMLGVLRALGYGYSIWEFQVYGKPKYVWSPNDGSISDIYSATPTFTPSVTTTYTVTIPDPCSGAVYYNMTVHVDCSSLPITLLLFDATLTADKAHLTWSTAQETNTDHFTLMSSTDGIHFVPVGIIKAAGNSSTVNQYSFTDPTPVSGIVYYKIVTTDTDGATQESQIKEVSPHTQEIGIGNSAFEEELSVLLPGKTSWIRLTIMDMLGRELLEVYKENISQDILLGKELAPACYLLRVETASQVQSFKVVKTK
ncbi:MAG TPA: discoidin domain-containing protein [Cytophagaceae bacterium]|nr:discoidin domain-containing protein [Cytophagaceae bacterium]